jgi:hypothetical protein
MKMFVCGVLPGPAQTSHFILALLPDDADILHVLVMLLQVTHFFLCNSVYITILLLFYLENTQKASPDA